MGNLELWISRQRRRLSLGTFLEAFADALVVFLLAFGTAVLLVKLGRPQWWPHVAWLVMGVLPIAWLAWRLSRRREISQSQAVAMLDRKLGAGGLLMTLSESYDEDWAAQLNDRQPDWRDGLPRLRPVRAARRLWLPLAFAIGCCFVPVREARTETIRPNVVGSQVAESLTDTLNLLRENNVLEEKDAQELKEAIEKLAQETKEAPLTHESWEVVDSLRDKMSVRTQESLTAASQARDALQTLSADAAKEAPSLTSERRQELEREAAESLRKLSKGGRLAKASPQLEKKLRQLMKNGRLTESKAEREKTLSDLKQFLDQESKKLKKCRGKCKGNSDSDSDPDSDEFNSEDGQEREGKPGRGGVTRGRADAKLTWGDEAEANGAKFKEVILPPGTPDKPNQEVISESASTPDVDPAAAASRGAPRSSGPETGRQTWNRTLRPRHRAAVRSYFETPSH